MAGLLMSARMDSAPLGKLGLEGHQGAPMQSTRVRAGWRSAGLARLIPAARRMEGTIYQSVHTPCMPIAKELCLVHFGRAIRTC